MRNLYRKSIQYGLVAFTTLALLPSRLASAAVDYTGGASPDDLNVEGDDLVGSIVNLLNWFLGFLGILAVILIIYAGILITTAAGKDDQVKKGRKIITYAVIGLVVIALAWGIVNFIIKGIGASSGGGAA